MSSKRPGKPAGSEKTHLPIARSVPGCFVRFINETESHFTWLRTAALRAFTSPTIIYPAAVIVIGLLRSDTRTVSGRREREDRGEGSSMAKRERKNCFRYKTVAGGSTLTPTLSRARKRGPVALPYPSSAHRLIQPWR